MFGFIKSWLDKRRLGKRGIYSYSDGQRTRYADPFRIWRGIMQHPVMNFREMAPFVDAGQDPECTIVIESLCQVFGVERWDEATRRGLTDWEIVGLASSFFDWDEGQKKSTSPGPIESPPSDPTSSSGPAPLDQATSSCTDSAPTPTA